MAPAPGGKDLEVTWGRTEVTTEVRAPFTQGHIPWMVLMDPTGEEKMAEIQNKPMKTRKPGLKTPESLAKSSKEDNKVKRVLTQRRTMQQEGVRDQMTPKKKTPFQTSGRELRGAEQDKTLDMMIIRSDTLRQSAGKDQSNHPNHQLKRKQSQGAVSKRTLAVAEHLRMLPVKLDEAQDDTHPFRPEGAGEHIIRTTGRARGTGTRCRRARRRRQGV